MRSCVELKKAVSKRNAAVECDVSRQSDKNKGDVRSRKSRVIKPVKRYVEYDVLSSSDNDSDAVEFDKVLKCVKPAVKKSENRCVISRNLFVCRKSRLISSLFCLL